MNPQEKVQNHLANPHWRINNLYYIVDKSGRKIQFSLNWAQKKLYHEMWYCNVILKARQLGISTFVCVLFLDRCLFNSNSSAGIIAHTREDAEYIFKRIKYAYDNLPDQLKSVRPATADSARELVFSNGSSIRVGTSMRGSTLNYLHISEFGKICAKYPDKAQEIITGSLNTVAPGQYVFIESTAEGKSGYFYDICKKAQKDLIEQKELSKLDFRFHFFPWWQEPTYKLGSTTSISNDLHEYFFHLKSLGIDLTNEQKYWYSARQSVQKEDMKREFPSTPDESWEVSNEGLYYGKIITQMRYEKRIGNVPYDSSISVHTAWDLGYNDSTAIWFFQVVGKEIHLIDYVEGSGESLQHWIGVVRNKTYIYDKHLAPHDISGHSYQTGMSNLVAARKMGFNFIPVPRHEIIAGIDSVRNLLNRCWIDEKKCEMGIKALENYKKEWDDKIGTWKARPLHNWASHGSDSLRYLAAGLHFITNVKTEAQKERERMENMKDRSGLMPGHYLYMPDIVTESQNFLNQRKNY